LWRHRFETTYLLIQLDGVASKHCSGVLESDSANPSCKPLFCWPKARNGPFSAEHVQQHHLPHSRNHRSIRYTTQNASPYAWAGLLYQPTVENLDLVESADGSRLCGSRDLLDCILHSSETSKVGLGRRSSPYSILCYLSTIFRYRCADHMVLCHPPLHMAWLNLCACLSSSGLEITALEQPSLNFC
jgi:hypothetical protein